MPGAVTFRSETIDDRDATRQVIVEAFSASEFGHNGEADLVDALRKSNGSVSFVACLDGEPVGHLMFSPVCLNVESDEVYGLGLAPMSVRPSRQRMGIGTKLLNFALHQIDDDGCRFAVVQGHPEFYSRFGFVPARDYGIAHGFAGIPQQFLFVRFFDDELRASITEGWVRYAAEFGSQSW